jgi:endonuclease YncB( thermonuclease family)
VPRIGIPLLVVAVFVIAATLKLHETDTPAGPLVVGMPRVIDGDTFDIGRTRIRLFGIDAPEREQTCSKDGKALPCGQQATAALLDRLGSSPVSCRQMDTDPYGRTVAVCTVDGADINAWMVRTGHAVAYRHYSLNYVSAEHEARDARRGLWATRFEMPWNWRRRVSER